MAQQITKEGHAALTNKAFDVAEVPVRNWISYFTEKSSEDLFKDKINKADSIWLHPTKPGEKYIELKIKMVSKDYKHSIGDSVNEKRVQDAIQFLAYSINTVYHPIVAKIDDNPNDIKNITVAWDEKNYIYIPQYTPPPVKKLNVLTNQVNYLLSCKENVMKDGTETQRKEWHADYKKVLDDQTEARKEVEPLKEQINEKNKYLESCKRIGISVKKYKESQLPKTMFMKNLPTIKAAAYQ